MTTTYAPPLHVVPTPPSGTDRSLFAALLAARRLARRVLDRILAVPQAAARYVLASAGHWLTNLPRFPFAAGLRWLAGMAASVLPVIKAVGILPTTLAVLTTPPVQRMAARGLRLRGHLVVKAGAALHRATDGLLRRCGGIGARLAERLTALRDAARRALRRLTRSTGYVVVADAVRKVLGQVRPLSRGLLAHRVLALLLPPLWLRVVLEFLIVPLFLDGHRADRLLTLVKEILSWFAGHESPWQRVVVVDAATTSEHAAPDPGRSSGEANEFDDLSVTLPPQNRAERPRTAAPAGPDQAVSCPALSSHALNPSTGQGPVRNPLGGPFIVSVRRSPC